jgi:hypothetical protein
VKKLRPEDVAKVDRLFNSLNNWELMSIENQAGKLPIFMFRKFKVHLLINLIMVLNPGCKNGGDAFSARGVFLDREEWFGGRSS